MQTIASPKASLPNTNISHLGLGLQHMNWGVVGHKHLIHHTFSLRCKQKVLNTTYQLLPPSNPLLHLLPFYMAMLWPQQVGSHQLALKGSALQCLQSLLPHLQLKPTYCNLTSDRFTCLLLCQLLFSAVLQVSRRVKLT